MNSPAWCRALLGGLAPEDQVDAVVGDLEEAHRRRLERGSWRDRVDAARTLGAIGPSARRAVPALRRAAKSGVRDLEYFATAALETIER